MRPPQCQNSRSVVGSVILFPTVRRAWNNLSQACARTAPPRRSAATRQPVQLRGVLPPLCILTRDCPSLPFAYYYMGLPFLPFASLPPARHPKPPGLNLQHQLPTCALYALHASMNDVPSHVRQGPTFEHACTFVNVCVQRWLGGGPRANRCPRVLTSSRVPVSSQLRRAAHQEPGGGPVQPKQKQSPFASRSVQRALLKRRRACKRGSGYRRGKERVKSSL